MVLSIQQNFWPGDLYNQIRFLAPRIVGQTAIAPPEQGCSGGGGAPCWNCCSFWGKSAPPKFFINPAFQNTLTLLLMACMVLLWWISSLLYGYWDLCRCWLYYVTIRLNYRVSIFKNMGVAANGPHPLSDIAPKPSLLNFLEITPAGWLDMGSGSRGAEMTFKGERPGH